MPLPMDRAPDVTEVKELFNMVRGLETLKKQYGEEKRSLKRLYEEIQELQKQKNGIDLTGLQARICELEGQYADIFRKIDLCNTRESPCCSPEHLEHVFECTADPQLQVRKCIELISSLVSVHAHSREAFCLLDASPAQGNHAGVVRVARSVEMPLAMAYNRGVWTDVSNAFTTMIKERLGERMPAEVACYLGTSSYIIEYFNGERGQAEALYNDGYERVELVGLAEAAPKSGSLILSLLKGNLATSVVTKNLPLDGIKENNDRLKGSEAHIKNIDDWVLDTVMKHALALSKGTGLGESEIDTVFIRETGTFVSEHYSQLRTCQRLFHDVSTARKEKARPILGKAVVKFFEERGVREHRDMFMAYSDITDQIRHGDGIVGLDALRGIREPLFMDIIKLSAALDLGTEDAPLVKKAKLKSAVCDFTENVNAFVTEGAKGFFISQFFGSLYGNFLAFLLRPRKHSPEELGELADVTRYALDLSFGHRGEPMANCDKLKSMVSVMEAPITRVIDMHNRGQICLDKTELRTAVRMFFDPCNERDNFLETIY